MNTQANSLLLIMTSWLCVFTLNPAFADDTEIYINKGNMSAEQTRPNVLFILDSSGSMGFPLDEDEANEELDEYEADEVYPGKRYSSGGPGDPNYYYLYRRDNKSIAKPFMYYNKVHKSQLADDVSHHLNRLASSKPHYYFYGTPEVPICEYISTACTFNAGPSQVMVVANLFPAGKQTPLYIVTSNFHNFLQSYYRYTTLQSVMREVIDAPFNVNMSLMRFNRDKGGYVIKESMNAESLSSQSNLTSAIDNLTFIDYTPLTESLWEAYLYMAGKSPFYGKNLSVKEAFEAGGNIYNSPIDFACQKSHIILVTDGYPTKDIEQNNRIKKLVPDAECEEDDDSGEAEDSCLDELAWWLSTDKTNKPSKRRDHSTLEADQTISVHTVGFDIDDDEEDELLQVTAEKGQGQYHSASSAETLKEAFKSILTNIDVGKDTFVAPALSVNAYSGLQHRNELYFALFKPNLSPRWYGNVKKYKLTGSVITDQNNTRAIDPETGYFYDKALSFWTKPADLDHDGKVDFTVDGGEIRYGGLATQLGDPANRTIYTHTGKPPSQALKLTELLDNANKNITAELLGLTNSYNPALERSKIINWARGSRNDKATFYVADLIHNQASVVTYHSDAITNKKGKVTRVDFTDVVFAGSNMGFLHAIDALKGKEKFAIVPKEMLKNLTIYYQNKGSFNDKAYGLDAPMTIWRHDDNSNGSIVSKSGTPETNDFVYLYQALRRGGSTIYAFDMTRIDTPKLLWQITGTANNEFPSGEFRDLAQTWSTPQRGVINWNCSDNGCEKKRVLFFGGGYDPVFDNQEQVPPRNSKGNAIYMVDAVSGDLLWSAGQSNHHTTTLNAMNTSIAADVTVGDIDSDGAIDLLYAVDVRGGLWRFDFKDNASNSKQFATGGKVADLGGGQGKNIRRFYNAPDVAFFASRGSAPMLTVSVSSGYRAHPLNTDINDYLFVIFDPHARSAPENYFYVNNSAAITSSDLDISPQSSKYGWKMPFSDRGEKGLSRTITFDNKIIMTSYMPEPPEMCKQSLGNGRTYILDALTGKSLLRDKNNTIIPYTTMADTGIPPTPAVIYSSEEICTANCDGPDNLKIFEKRPNILVCVGTECIDDVVDHKLHRMFWRAN